MMNWRMVSRGFVSLATIAFLPVLASASDQAIGAIGESATLRIEQDGARYDVIVTPPPDAAVNKAVLAWVAGTEDAAAQATGDPLDLSGYTVTVSPPKSLAGPMAECSGKFTLKPRPIALAAKKGFRVKAKSIFMSVTAFPTSGDVDVAVYYGPDDRLTICQFSSRGPRQMDTAGCVLTTCHNDNSADDHTGWISNYSNEKATYVGSFDMVFVTLP